MRYFKTRSAAEGWTCHFDDLPPDVLYLLTNNSPTIGRCPIHAHSTLPSSRANNIRVLPALCAGARHTSSAAHPDFPDSSACVALARRGAGRPVAMCSQQRPPNPPREGRQVLGGATIRSEGGSDADARRRWRRHRSRPPLNLTACIEPRCSHSSPRPARRCSATVRRRRRRSVIDGHGHGSVRGSPVPLRKE